MKAYTTKVAVVSVKNNPISSIKVVFIVHLVLLLKKAIDCINAIMPLRANASNAASII